MPPLLKIIQTPKMAALLLLGFSSGLPLFLTSSTLQAWMKDAKVDLGTIGWFSLVGLPYTLKFFWSPLLDRFVPPVLGRRRAGYSSPNYYYWSLSPHSDGIILLKPCN